MKRPLRTILSSALALAILWFAWLSLDVNGDDTVTTEIGAVADPYESELLADYGRYRDAIVAVDLDELREIAAQSEGYLRYKAALTLAESPELSPIERLEFYRLVDELRIDEPLARSENRRFHLEYAATAEAAAAPQEALAHYLQALPLEEAISAVARLEEDPYRLANHYLQAGLAQQALEALDGRSAPSIEAPAHGRLNNHQEALDAYERWLVEQPQNMDALFGRAWQNFYLDNRERADELFAGLPGSTALYGRALIARRNNDLPRAVELMRETNDASRLWLATGWLEARDLYREAVPVYLQLAQTSSVYADDAAYRALVLAERLGDETGASRARELLPEDSFFALKLGADVPTPARTLSNELSNSSIQSEAIGERDSATGDSSAGTVRPQPVIQLAWELARVNDVEAARGELMFALREASDEATTIELAEALQLLGEFRQSQRAAQLLVNAGSQDPRTWRVAYPRAYPEIVEEQAREHSVEPALIWAVMKQESAFYPKAVSTSNAMGLMQVVPTTWDWLAELQEEDPADPFEPAANIRYGAYYLRWLLNYHDGDEELVIPSYNRGQGYIRRLFESDYVAGNKDDFYREIDALETREYLQRVTLNYEIYKALYGQEQLAQAD